jgi:predicted ribosomally synthesized peptide with SipW-like signal peptide
MNKKIMTKKNKNKYFSFVRKQFSKFAVVLVVVSMLFGTLGINQTSAYFTSSATVSGSTFTAGTLAISLDNTNTFSSGLLYPTDSISQSMNISNTGSLDSQYIAKTTPIEADNSACDYIKMIASNGEYTYTGLIKDFTSSAIPTTNATWNYNFTVSSSAPSSVWGKTCYFNWNYTAWQSNLSDSSSGFTNILEKSGAIKVGKAVVLNEILYNPKSTDPAPANKEFIELYNNSNLAIDIAGMQVSEISGSAEKKYTITTTSGSLTAVPNSGSTIISPKGWMTLILSDPTALNNTGDTVRLYDAINNKLDEYTYVGGKPVGNSEARMPDGVGAWVDPIPTPGESNELAPLVEPEVEDITTPEVPDITTNDATVTTGDSKADTTVESALDTTTTEQPVTDTIVTTDQTALIDIEASDEDPTVEQEIAEPALVVETLPAPVVEAEAPAIE